MEMSPSSGRHDRITKYKRCQRAGVPEYWVVDPVNKSVHVFILNGDKYTSFVYEGGEKIPVHVLPGFEIDLTDVFTQDETGPEEVTPGPVGYEIV